MSGKLDVNLIEDDIYIYIVYIEIAIYCGTCYKQRLQNEETKILHREDNRTKRLFLEIIKIQNETIL